ncbi:hypothetical protein [Microlunatus sp. GCM10028923]|uniref:hypothetical protein n=1 Tax=Microlunatus sp. GCM10028923 TaxID=3273400 RepID=UPI0036099755
MTYDGRIDGDDATAETIPELHHRVILSLSRAAFELSAVAGLADGRVEARATQAVAAIDEAIAILRHAAFSEILRSPRDGVAEDESAVTAFGRRPPPGRTDST